MAFGAGFGIELVHEVDDVEESSATAVSHAGAGDADGEMGLAGPGAADQHEVALMVEEVSGGQVADQGLVDVGRLEVELVEFLGQGKLGDRHLVFDRTRLFLGDLCGQEIADDPLRFMLSFESRADDLIVGGPHSVELQFPHRVDHV